uniref:valine--tRNA ligase n=1 Tax=Callorhinchus milii TaxID=7868 RepID=A0A4W3GSX6_CALMI
WCVTGVWLCYSDWCVSRQLWWGHRIPAYQVSNPDSETQDTVWVSGRTEAEARRKASQKLGIPESELSLRQGGYSGGWSNGGNAALLSDRRGWGGGVWSDWEGRVDGVTRGVMGVTLLYSLTDEAGEGGCGVTGRGG